MDIPVLPTDPGGRDWSAPWYPSPVRPVNPPREHFFEKPTIPGTHFRKGLKPPVPKLPGLKNPFLNPLVPPLVRFGVGVGRHAWNWWMKRRRMKQGGRMRKRTRFRPARSSAVTKYLNRSAVYRRRPMPRFRRRRYVKRINFVKKVINSDLAAKTFLFTSGGTTTTTSVSAATSQGFAAFSMYGDSGAGQVTTGLFTSCGDKDLLSLYSDLNGGVTNTARIFHVRGAVLDVSIQNVGQTNPVFMDVYKIACRRDVGVTGNVFNIPQVFGAQLNEQTVPTGTTLLGVNTWPTTIFDNSGFCRYFKVLSKVRTQLDPGAMLQLQIKDQKQRQFTLEDIEVKLFRRGWTQTYVILFWGVPNATPQNWPGPAAITWSCSRRYRASVMSANDIQAGYAPI